jgi:ubiquitin-conjugating enzyme E2 Z
MDKKNIVSKDTIYRIVSEIKELNNDKNELSKNGIYYCHDENNILNGYCLIIGQKDTPYHHGFYLFEFIFPYDYPFSPPKVIFYTNDGVTRFNPNLYINGKVCISLLNTWRGEQWTSCQTIRTILLTLVTLLNNEPLTNEPGIKKTHKDFNNYNKIITYKNLYFTIYKQFIERNLFNKYPEKFNIFFDDIDNYFKNNYNDIIDQIKNLLNIYPNEEIIKTSIYNLSCSIDYKNLLKNFIEYKI